MKALNILVIQPDCREYRVPLFKSLASFFRVSILHFGEKKFTNHEHITEVDMKLKKAASFKYIYSLNKECNKYDCIVPVFDPHWLNCFFLPLLTKKPVIFWGHGVGHSKLISYVRRRVGKKAKALIAYDEAGKQSLIDIGMNPQKLFIAPNTMHVYNTINFAEEEKNEILYVGRLQKRKELDLLIRCFANIQERLPKNIRLKILGNGDDILLELKELVEKHNLTNKVIFVKGTTDQKKLAQQFKKAYCYASPGHVGLGVLHSFAYGVPVITFRERDHAPEVSNIEHGLNGELVKGGIKEFGDSLVKLINSGSYRNLGNNAYLHYSNKRTINHMVDGFKEAIKYSLRE